MKKILTAAIGLTMMTSAVCSAEISSNELVLGGIKYGATVSEVENAFGQPDKSKHRSDINGDRLKYEYHDDLEFKFADGNVYEIEVEKNSNIKTAAGIGIGASVAEVEKAYGKPDFIRKDKYIYCTSDKSLGLIFKLKNGVVREIKCGILY